MGVVRARDDTKELLRQYCSYKGCAVWLKRLVRARFALIVCRGVHPRQVLMPGGALVLFIVRGVWARRDV